MRTFRLFAIAAGCFFAFANCMGSEGNPAGQSIEDTNDVRTDMTDEFDDRMNDADMQDTMDIKDYPGDSL